MKPVSSRCGVLLGVAGRSTISLYSTTSSSDSRYSKRLVCVYKFRHLTMFKIIVLIPL
jgi:hypothetical protein